LDLRRGRCDPESARTEHVYDTTYRLFESQTRLPKYFDGDTRFRVFQDWDSDGDITDDFRCGVPSKITDINNQTTDRIFDNLCRLTRETRPGGDYTVTDYTHMSVPATPANQWVETKRPAPNLGTDDDDWSNSATINETTDQVWSRVHLDGFGRKWKEQFQGLTADDRIVIERVFNERGFIKRESAPYYLASEPRKDEIYSYDSLDRLIEQKHPDDTSITLAHGLSTSANEVATVLVTDETNRKTRYHFDAQGKLVQRVKLYGGTSEAATKYERDLLERIAKVFDPNGNKWTYQYDGLSRRFDVKDPDLGHWTYDYDYDGRLTKQTDAKNQDTVLTYDVMDRVKTKSVETRDPATGTLTGTELTTNTYDNVSANGHAGFFNVGKLTDSVKGSLTQRYDYDAGGRLAKSRWAGITGQTGERAIDSTYWHGGELRTRVFPSGLGSGSSTSTASYTYDAAGRLNTVKNGSTALVSSTEYNSRGRATDIAYGNLVATKTTTIRTAAG
jgi:YD repeat-containing protein